MTSFLHLSALPRRAGCQLSSNLQRSVACRSARECDHPAGSQVKIGALFILLGPVILTKKHRRKPRPGGARLEQRRRGRGAVRKSGKDMGEIIRSWPWPPRPLDNRTQHTRLRLAPPALPGYHLGITQPPLVKPDSRLLSVHSSVSALFLCFRSVSVQKYILFAEMNG